METDCLGLLARVPPTKFAGLVRQVVITGHTLRNMLQFEKWIIIKMDHKQNAGLCRFKGVLLRLVAARKTGSIPDCSTHCYDIVRQVALTDDMVGKSHGTN